MAGTFLGACDLAVNKTDKSPLSYLYPGGVCVGGEGWAVTDTKLIKRQINKKVSK